MQPRALRIPLDFHEPVPLCTSEGVATLANALAHHPAFKGWGIPKLEKSLAAWKAFGPRRWTPTITNRGLLEIDHGDDAYETLGLPRVIEVGAMLHQLQKCKGFEEACRNFDNRTQFSATMFEIESASLCYSCKSVFNLEFEPDVETRRPGKRPDFGFEEVGFGRIVCECKDMTSMNRAHESIRKRLPKLLMQEIEATSALADYRVEVLVQRIPPGNLHEWVRRIAECATASDKDGRAIPIEGTAGNIAIAVCAKGTPRTFQFGEYIACLGRERPPIGMTVDDCPLVIVLQFSKATDVGGVLAEANQQLPKNQWGVVFLVPPSLPDAVKALERRVKEDAYRYLLAVAIRLERDWKAITKSQMGEDFSRRLFAILPKCG